MSLTDVTFDGQCSKIGISAFEGCEKLTAFTYYNPISLASGSVATIGNSAFKDCTSLKTINVENWSSVGAYAFQGCTSLTTATLKFIKTIGNEAFKDCTSLEILTFNIGVGTIGNNVFENCTSLVNVDMSLLNYNSYNVDSTFGTYNFLNCINLQTVVMPDALIGISTGTFKECVNLERVKRSGNEVFGYSYIYDAATGERKPVYHYGTDYIAVIENEAFYNCGNLVEVISPRFLVKIGSKAFYNCKSLPEYSTTRSVLSELVSSDAFEGCSSSFVIKAPSNSGMAEFTQKNGLKLTPIADDLVDDEFLIYEVEDDTVITGYRGGFKSLAIREPSVGTYRIDGEKSAAWIDCQTGKNVSMKRYLEKLTLRNVSVGSSESSGKSQFSGCIALTDLIFEENPDIANAVDLTICESGFSGCTKLNNLVFCDNITTIGKKAFYNCSSLEKVSLPKNCIRINEECFSSCKSLNKLKLNSKLNEINKQAFLNCNSLTTVTIPGNVYIGEYVFKGCKSIMRVIVPSNVNMATSADALIDCVSGEEGLTLVTDAASKITGYAAEKGFNVEYASFVNGVNAVDIITKGHVIDTENKIASITKNNDTYENIKTKTPEAVADSYDNKNFTSYNYSIEDNEDYVVEGDVLKITLDSSLGFVPFVTINDKNVVDVIDGVATYTVGENEHVNIKPAYGNYYYLKKPANVSVKRKNEYLANNAIINANDMLTITADPENGYELKSLTVNGNKFVNGNSYVVGDSENVIIEAEFAKIEYHIVIPKNVTVYRDNTPIATGAVINEGDVLTIIASIPGADYVLNKLTLNNEVIENNSTYTVKNGENVKIVVRFIQPGVTGGYPYGDSNADEAVTQEDVREALKKILNADYIPKIEKEISYNYINVLDVDGDGEVTASDVAEILMKSKDENYVFTVENK